MFPGFRHPFSAFLLILAGLLGAIGVGSAAYAAHGALDDSAVRLIDLASRLSLIHAAALVALAAAGCSLRRIGRLAAFVLGIGVALFSAVLLTDALVGRTIIAPLAPVGGTAMILGWLGLAFNGLLDLLDQTVRRG